MSDEIPTPITDRKSFAILWIHDTSKVVVDVEDSRELERELIALQQKVRELQAAAVPDTHRTCTECHRLLPATLFPKLHGNESVCGECYFPCGEVKP